jgi:hypothetical protein
VVEGQLGFAASGRVRILASPAILSHGGRVSQENLPPTQPSTPSETIEVMFPDLRYDRICRTAHSEAYLLSDGDDPFGRVDLHFGSSVVHGVLIVERDLADEDLHGLVQRIDDDLVWTADQAREDFLVTVYRGTETGVISDREGNEADEDEEEDEHKH